MISKGLVKATNAILLIVAGFNVFSRSKAYDVRRYDQDNILAVRSHNEQRVDAIFYEPAGKLHRGKPTTGLEKPRPSAGTNRHRKTEPDLNGVPPAYGPAVVQPTVIKKTLRNENGILRYRPAGYISKKARKSKKRKHLRRGRPRTTKALRRTTARSKIRRRNRLKGRRTKKLKPANISNRNSTPIEKYHRKKATARRFHERPYSTRPSQVSRKLEETTRAAISKTTPSSSVHHRDSPTKSHPTSFDISSVNRRQRIAELNAANSNQYGLVVPSGFRLTTASLPDNAELDVTKTPKSRTTKNPRTTTVSKKYRPTNPSLSILQIPTSSIDDAYMVLRDVGAGFRVRLVPTTAIQGKDLTTAKIDELDILSGRNATDSGSSDKRDTAISALRALFRKLSNATDFHPRRLEATYNRDRELVHPTSSNGSWWGSEHVCVTESHGLFGVPSSIFDRLTVTTECNENEEMYECTERFGTGNNAPKKTTSYRCCQGFRKSANSKRCEPVELLLDDDPNLMRIAGFSTDKEFSPDATYDQSQEHTIFMPNDEVVSEYLAGNQVDSKDKNDVQMFLENHVIVGENLPSTSMKNNQLLTALSGNTIRVNFFEDRKQMTVNCRRVLQRDVTNDNSMVHFIGDIIREVKGSLYDYISKNYQMFSMFKSVVDSSGLAALLQSVNATITLFLPTNEAFEMTGGIPDSPDCLASIVRNHLLDGIICSAVWNRSNATLRTQEGENLRMKVRHGKNWVNSALILNPDIMTTNGVVHVLDGLLQPLKAQSVLTLMDEDPNNSEMLRYLELGGMKDVLTSGDNFTLIVPNNDAFESLPSGVTKRLMTKPDALLRFLLHHTIPFELSDSQLSSVKVLNTLDPQGRLRVSSYNVRVSSRRGDNVINARKRTAAVQCARVSSTVSKRACNGAIFQIGRALVPPTGSVFSVLRQAPRGNFSILLRAITKVKLVQALAKSEEITFFAPTNDAFERLPARFVKFLFQNVRALQKLLRFHITKGFHCCDYMAQGYARLPTLLGPTVTSCPKAGHILLGRNQKRLRAKVVKCEIMAKNGILHAIDNVLIPSGFRD